MKPVLLALLSLAVITGYSQSFTAAVLRPGQTAYIGIDNTVSCTVEGLKCKSVVLTTNNGSIEKIDCGLYVFRPEYLSDGSIVINKKVKNKLVKIGEFFLRVRNMPAPIAHVGGGHRDTIAKGALAAQAGLGAYAHPSLGFELNYTVKSFAIIVIRNKEVLHFKSTEGNLFDEETKEVFKLLGGNDKVVFSSIVIAMPDQKTTLINPFELTIR
jgi:GldM C-terminal domain